MRRYPAVLLFFAIIFFATHEGQAQTPDLALRYFQAGEIRMQEGDWLSAVEDFTKAIIVNAKFKGPGLPNKSSKAFDTTQSETNELSVCDPFTAGAYRNHGLARYTRVELVDKDELLHSQSFAVI